MSLPLRCSRPAPLLSLLAASLVAACGGTADVPEGTQTADDGAIGGTLVWAIAGQPGSLLPPRARDIVARQVADLVYDRLAQIGPSLNTYGEADFTPRLAERWEWGPDSTTLTFHIDPRARWHDGRPVRAEDVRFTHALHKDPKVASTELAYLGGIDSVSAPDSLQARVWFNRRYPEQFFDAAARLVVLPSHLLAGVAPESLDAHPLATAPVGSGPFRFGRAEPGRFIELAADSANFRGRPKLDRVVMAFAAPDASLAQLVAGEADLFEALRPETMASLAQAPHVRVHLDEGAAYGYLAFNQQDPADSTRPHPVFDRATRRALSMLVDRPALVRAAFDSLGVVGQGPLPRAVFAAEGRARALPFDAAAAAALLDSAGWRDADGDGVRERAGRPLAFKILVPTSSEFRKRVAFLLQQQLAPAGVKVELDAVEYQALGERMMQGRFDAALGSWALTEGSPGGLRNTWSTRTAAGRGKQNYGRYASAAFDAHVDSTLAAPDPAQRDAHLARAFQVILDDAPAVWLYEPLNAIGVHQRFVTPPLRAAVWWLDLPRWSVRPGAELPRDRAGAGAAPVAAR